MIVREAKQVVTLTEVYAFKDLLGQRRIFLRAANVLSPVMGDDPASDRMGCWNDAGINGYHPTTGTEYGRGLTEKLNGLVVVKVVQQALGENDVGGGQLPEVHIGE